MVAGTISLTVFPVLGDRRLDQDEARALVQQGKMLPLERLLERHAERLRGQLLDVELEREGGRLIYEIEVLGQDGRVWEVELDARSGDLLRESRDD